MLVYVNLGIALSRPFESIGARLGRANTAPLAARGTVNADLLAGPLLMPADPSLKAIRDRRAGTQ